MSMKTFLMIISATLAIPVGITLGEMAPRPFWRLADLEASKAAVLRMNILGAGSCSLTIVSDTEALTAAHCIPHPAAYLQFVFSSPLSTPMFLVESKVAITPAGVVPQVDAALVKGDFRNLPKANGVDRIEGEVFTVDKAVLCGYPIFSNELRCVVAKRAYNRGFAAAFDTVVIPGQSGGAVFNMDGKLIGIIHSVRDNDGYTYVASTVGILTSGDVK